MKHPDHYRLGTLLLGDVEQAVLQIDREHHSLEALLGAPASVFGLLQDWDRADRRLGELAAALRRGDLAGVPVDVGGGRWLPPVRSPRKLVIAGLNYHDHAEDMGARTLPDRPYLLLKPASTSLAGSGTAVPVPGGVERVDYEAELAVVIGTRARDVPASRALDAVAGYAVLNDITARNQGPSGTGPPTTGPLGPDWLRLKGYDAFTPMGPYLTPARFVASPQALAIRLWVNEELRQDSSTAKMITGIAGLIEHASSIFTLEPGDVIATGTPGGVGHARRPPRWLADGDRITVEIEDLGRLEHRMSFPPGPARPGDRP